MTPERMRQLSHILLNGLVLKNGEKYELADFLASCAESDPVAWLQVSRTGLIRCARTIKPTAEDLAVAEHDGDTITPLYTHHFPGVSVPREPTEEMIDAPRQIILYTETPGRTLEGLRAHLRRSGVNYLRFFPKWAMQENGHLTKAAIAALVWSAMLAAAEGGK